MKIIFYNEKTPESTHVVSDFFSPLYCCAPGASPLFVAQEVIRQQHEFFRTSCLKTSTGAEDEPGVEQEQFFLVEELKTGGEFRFKAAGPLVTASPYLRVSFYSPDGTLKGTEKHENKAYLLGFSAGLHVRKPFLNIYLEGKLTFARLTHAYA